MDWNFGRANEKQSRNSWSSPIYKTDCSFSYNKIYFIDTIVCKTDSGKTSFCRKESNQKMHLHRKFEHLEFLKQSVPFGQVLRVRRICSTKNKFQQSCNELNNKLIGRRHLEQEKDNSIERTKTFDKTKLLE